MRLTLDPLIRGKALGTPWWSFLPLRNRVPDEPSFRFLVGRPIRGTSRHGKILFVHSETGGLVVRLGMSGRCLVQAQDAPLAPHTHLRWPLAPGEIELRYVDPRRFGDVRPFVDEEDRAAVIAPLGPDPTTLDQPAVAQAVSLALRRTRRSLKAALLDQALIAGLGNIYVCEALFIARLSPFRAAKGLTAPEATRLLAACHQVIQDGIARRGTTLNDYVDAEGRQGDNQHHLFVFAREGDPCHTCGTAVRRKTQANRSTYYCARCQRAR